MVGSFTCMYVCMYVCVCMCVGQADREAADHHHSAREVHRYFAAYSGLSRYHRLVNLK